MFFYTMSKNDTTLIYSSHFFPTQRYSHKCIQNSKVHSFHSPIDFLFTFLWRNHTYKLLWRLLELPSSFARHCIMYSKWYGPQTSPMTHLNFFRPSVYTLWIALSLVVDLPISLSLALQCLRYIFNCKVLSYFHSS